MGRLFTPTRLFWLTVAAATLTWVMIFIGGTVNPTGSSLACPSWEFTFGFIPLCKGEVFPAMTDGVQYEHGHRLWGWLVGLATTGVTLGALLSKRLPRKTKWLAVTALFLVIAQGALGGVTVKLKLHPLVSTGHLVLGYLFLSLMVYLAWRVHPWRREAPAAGACLPRGAPFVAVGLVLTQVALGAAIRHYGAGMFCGDDWLSCGGLGLWPQAGLGKLHMVHRLFGYAVGVTLLVLMRQANRRARAAERPLAARLAWLPATFVLVQIALGILTVATGKSVAIVTLHTAVGGLLLTSTVAVAVALGPLGDPAARRDPHGATPPEPREAAA